MRVVRLSFREDPAVRAAAYLVDGGIDPLKTVVVVPTQRFKTYFARVLLDSMPTRSGLSPYLMTSGELTASLVSQGGKPLVSDTERLSLLYRACEQTPELYDLFPDGFLKSFSSYTAVSKRLLRSFEELEREEKDLSEVDAGAGFAGRNVKILEALRENYVRVQHERECCDLNFLLGEVSAETIREFFSPFDTVLLLAPVSLTRFERRVFETLDRRLIVFYQDTDTYDFSRVLAFSAGSGKGSVRGTEEWVGKGSAREACIRGGGRVRFLRAASRTDQLMMVISLIREGLEGGVELRDIAVLNSDPAFGRMLYESLCSLGIEANLSAGLPVRLSPFYQFLLLVCRFFSTGLDTELFLELLKNEFFVELEGGGNGYAGMNASRLELRERLVRNRVFRLKSLASGYITRDDRRRECIQLLHRVYESGSFRSLHESLRALCERLETRGKTYAYYAVRDIILGKTLDLFDFSSNVDDRPVEVLLQTLRTEDYALQGVYTRGVQVLGLLETRGISFKNLIVPFFNEGFYPLKRENDLLLSREVRDALGLPSFIDREELSFYYLDRLVEASESTVFITGDNKSGEVGVTSRYAYHFGVAEKGEGPHLRYTLPVRGTSVARPSPAPDQPVLSVPVRDVSRLDMDLLKACETKYFIARTLGLQVKNALTRDISPALVGQLVHRILAELYAEPGVAALEEGELAKRLHRLIEKHFPEGLFYSREEDLLTAILKENLVRALREDTRRFERGYRVCGEYMERDLEARLAGGRYRIRGRIDRVDRSPDGGYVLIDYKTGSVPSGVSHREQGGFREVQLGFYGLLLNHEEPGVSIEGLCYFDLGRSHRMVNILKGDEVGPYLSRFEEHVTEFLSRYEDDTVLVLADDPKTCLNCPFDAICRVYEP
jgi:RecB family exonuclease